MIKKLFCANQTLNEDAIASVLERQMQLEKPEGALGKLEEIVVRLGSHQGNGIPDIKTPWISIFAGDHGVAQQEVSELESDYPKQFIARFEQSKTAINVLADFSNARTEVIDVGIKTDIEPMTSLVNAKVAKGTQDFTQQAAMTELQLIQAMEAGIEAAERAKATGADLFIGGEVGIANTTSALAMIAVLSGKPALELVSLGKTRALHSEKHRAEVIDKALALHKDQLNSPLRILQVLGGFETAALCAAYIRSVQLGMTIVVDGLMATTAFWIADLISRNDQLVDCDSVESLMKLGQYSVPETMFCLCGNCPRLVDWCFFAHQSEVAAHGLVLEILAAEPLIKFDMKLGEGSGAALVIPLLRQACLLNSQALKVE